MADGTYGFPASAENGATANAPAQQNANHEELYQHYLEIIRKNQESHTAQLLEQQTKHDQQLLRFGETLINSHNASPAASPARPPRNHPSARRNGAHGGESNGYQKSESMSQTVETLTAELQRIKTAAAAEKKKTEGFVEQVEQEQMHVRGLLQQASEREKNLTAQLRAAERRYEEAELGIRQVLKSSSTCKELLAQLAEEHRILQKEHAETLSALKELEFKESQEISQTTRQVNALMADVEDLKHGQQRDAVNISRLEGLLDNSKEDYDRERMKVEALKRECADLRKQKNETESARVVLAQECASLRYRLSGFVEDFSDRITPDGGRSRGANGVSSVGDFGQQEREWAWDEKPLFTELQDGETAQRPKTSSGKSLNATSFLHRPYTATGVEPSPTRQRYGLQEADFDIFTGEPRPERQTPQTSDMARRARSTPETRMAWMNSTMGTSPMKLQSEGVGNVIGAALAEAQSVRHHYQDQRLPVVSPSRPST